MSAVEDRLADALSARARLETVDAAALQQHREELRAGVHDDAGVHELDGEEVAAPGAPTALGAHRRRTVALAAAAAALVLTAAAVGIARVTGSASSPASRAPAGFSVLGVPGPPVVLPEGVPAPEGLVEGTLRDLVVSTPLSAWIYEDDQHRACLLVAVPDPQQSASACGDRALAETVGIGLGLVDVGLTATLFPDDVVTAPPQDDDLLPVAPNLWVDANTAGKVGAADVLAASADSFVVGPLLGSGTVDLAPLDAEGEYAVLLRCLTDQPVRVEVDGVAQVPEPGCGGAWSLPPALPVAVPRVGGAPVTVTVTAPEGASWSVGVVRCTAVARQCPSVPAATTTGVG